MKLWQKQFKSAYKQLEDAQDTLNRAAQNLAKKIGFVNYERFSASFSGSIGCAIVSFDDMSNELDMEEMAGMTKRQVIDEFAAILTFDQLTNMY